MTKTKATQMARDKLRYGYFRTDAQTGWVDCPLCGKHRLEIMGVMGRMPKHSEMVAQVAQGIRDCDYDRWNPIGIA